MIMMTFTEVKGGKLVAMAPNLVRRIPDAIYDDDNHHGGQRSSEVKCQRSNRVKYSKLCSMATNLVRRSLMTMMTFIEVKGQQRSNVVIYVIWLPYLVRCTTNNTS